MKKLIFITIFFLGISFNTQADNAYFINFTELLNNSKPGAQAQKKLKEKFESESKKFNKQEADIRKEEAKIISEKKALSPEDYQKKVESLRKKVADLQKNKQTSFNNIAKSRNDAKQALLKAVNPIIKKYMEENNIRLILDKQGVVMGDKTLEITSQIIAILDKELPSLKIN
jgi:Skp family chaperone for outer membrane proteins|tara:strand:+ start:3558 stop:4073 length:516 start_codon:yes stop_codon:yes gene_type:complete